MNRVCVLFIALLYSASAFSQSDNEITQLEQGLLPAVQIIGELPSTFSIEERMEHYHVPGVSIAIIQGGKIAWAKGYGVTNTQTQQVVDENTLFQAASISKPVSAMGALVLVEKEKIDLETDINTYLSRWKIPENKYTQQQPVHLKGLLSHTASTTVHGFPGYTQIDTFPTVEAVLSGAGNTDSIVVDTIPGTIWRYSGGGYTVAQLAIEEIAGKTFATYLEQAVLAPLDMTRSTFEQPLPKSWQDNVSAAFDSRGEMVEGLWNNYPELAAAGLWTTPTDLAKFCIAIQRAFQGKDEKMLSKEIVKKMLTPIANDYALGLGVETRGDTLFFGHGGKNRGFTNNMSASATHDMGIIIMTNADEGGNLIGEIMRSANKLYGWGRVEQKHVELFSLSSEEKARYIGRYNLKSDQGEDYIVEVQSSDLGVLIHDPQSTSNYLIPTSATEFIDRDSGRSVLFELDKSGEALGFLYGGRYHFDRVKR